MSPEWRKIVMSGYLFAHFIGEHKDGEQIYFAVSDDGLHWEDLNGGRPVLVSDAGEKGARDPFIVKNEDTGKYYLMATDLRIEAGKGWQTAQYAGSRSLLVWESTDLVNWTDFRLCQVGVEGAGCVWAPESVYISERGEFFVFWASMVKLDGDSEPKQRIYGAYTKDFKEFTKPEVYVEAANHVIDMNIVRDGDWYYRFVKDETTKKVRLDRVRTLEDKLAEAVPASVLDELYGVEGPEAYRLKDGRWCLIVDRFATQKGYLPLICSSLQAGDFKTADEGSYDMGGLKKRHGGIIAVSSEELERLKSHYRAI